MIPFARISKYGNTVADLTLLDIDFRKSIVGSTTIVDRSSHSNVFTKLNSGSASVVYDNTSAGNVMYFTGAIFGSPITSHSALDLSTKNWVMEFEYLSSAGATALVWGTGYYPDAANWSTGICYQIHQTSGQAQIFTTGNTISDYWRNYVTGAVDNAWRRVVITRIGLTTTATVYDMNGVQQGTVTGTNQPFGSSTTFGIGGYFKGLSSPFTGYLKYLNIKEIV